MLETTAAEVPAPAPGPGLTSGRWARRGNTASNLMLALLFFSGAIPTVQRYHDSVADLIWVIGAILMGLFSLVRIAPKQSAVNVRSISATAGMMMIPLLIMPSAPSVGFIYQTGVVIESIGVIFTQVSRVFLGRRFGLLPANRGIVSSGPFRLVRHPIYLGWIALTVGYSMIYPSARNMLTVFIILPFMMWRIEQEEELLREDDEYRAYMKLVPYRLIPFVF